MRRTAAQLFLVTLLFLAFCSTAQNIQTLAGTGAGAYSGDGGAATAAKLNTPHGVATGPMGAVYVADYNNNVIRKIDTFGYITTVAGTGVAGYSGDRGPATAAELRGPRGIAVDAAGNIFFSDYGNNRIRKVAASTRIITTIAGLGGPGFSGDGGAATAAQLNFAWGVAVDAGGNVYLADQLNCRVRKINTSGTISTVAGNGIAAYTGDGMAAVSSGVQYPLGVAVDAAGNLYIADNGNNRVRKVNTAGTISTLAGSATYGFTGDGGPSTAARLYYPQGIAVDAGNNVYIADMNNNRIRKINAAGYINTIAGNGVATFGGDGGVPTLASLNQPTGMATRADGTIFIADNNNNRVRYIGNSDAPFFTRGRRQVLVTCPTEMVYIDSFLSVYDASVGDTERWSLAVPPTNGLVAATYTTIATGSTLVTTGLTYTPTLGFIGTDSFTVRITDGTTANLTTIVVTILPLPDAGSVSGIDSICRGQTVTLSSTVAGGTWSSSNPAVGTINTTGVVTGATTGSTIIAYTVTNTCGSKEAYLQIVVGNCTAGILGNSAREPLGIAISPNPAKKTCSIAVFSPNNETALVTILDIVGNVISTMEVPTNEKTPLTLSAQPGLYYVRATTATASWAQALVWLGE